MLIGELGKTNVEQAWHGLQKICVIAFGDCSKQQENKIASQSFNDQRLRFEAV